jgi:hypothetical protein
MAKRNPLGDSGFRLLGTGHERVVAMYLFIPYEKGAIPKDRPKYRF